jgi:hypothetical protein
MLRSPHPFFLNYSPLTTQNPKITATTTRTPSFVYRAPSTNTLPAAWCPPPRALKRCHLLSRTSPRRRVPNLTCSLHQPEAEALAHRPRPLSLLEMEVLLLPRDPTLSPPPILTLAPAVIGSPVVNHPTSSPAATAAFLSIWRRQGPSLQLMGHVRIQRRQAIRFFYIITFLRYSTMIQLIVFQV